jgi:flagellar protein FliO/FliZ
MPGWSDGLQYLASFGLVIVLLVGLLWALKRLQGAKAFARREQRLQIVESLSLGTRHKVALIRCDHREVLVGITQTQITTLASWALPPGEVPEDVRARFSAAQGRARQHGGAGADDLGDRA